MVEFKDTLKCDNVEIADNASIVLDLQTLLANDEYILEAQNKLDELLSIQDKQISEINSCMNSCSISCTSCTSCSGECSTECTGSCIGNCHSGCTGGCLGFCQVSCTNECNANCSASDVDA